MQNRSRHCDFSVSLRTVFNSTNEISDIAAWDNDDDGNSDGDGGGGSDLSGNRQWTTTLENIVKGCKCSHFDQFQLYNFPFVRTFICFSNFASKHKRRWTRNERWPYFYRSAIILHRPNTTMTKLLYCIVFYPNKWLCETFITNYEMKIFTNLWFNMH